MADEAFLKQSAQAFLAGQGLFAAAVPPDAEAVIDGRGRSFHTFAALAAFLHKVPDQAGFPVGRQKGLLRRAGHQLAAAAENALHLGHAGGSHEAGALHGAAKDAFPQGRAQAQGRRAEAYGLAAVAAGHLVPAQTPKAGQHFPGQPLLEGQGTGLVAAGHEEVEAGLGQREHVLWRRGGLNVIDPPPLVGDMPDG